MKTKYVKIQSQWGEQIIVFSEILPHNTFKDMNPISAGLINIDKDIKGKVDCFCYGESDGLGLKADTENDSKLANQQILNRFN